jgi:hypothetical protein
MALIGLKQLDPILTGSLQVSGSAGVTGSIEVSGNISGSVTSTGSFGYLNVDGDAVIAGNFTFGDADTDSVSFTADISSSLIPDSSDSYNLGSDTKRWNDLYLSGSIDTTGGPITLTSDTTLSAKGNTGASFGDDTGTWEFNGSGAVSETGITTFSLTPSSTVDIDAGGAITLDGAEITIGGDGDTGDVALNSTSFVNISANAASTWKTAVGALLIENEASTITLDGATGVTLKEGGSNVIAIDTNRDVLFSQTGGTVSDPDVEIDGYFKVDGQTTFTAPISASSDISGSSSTTASFGRIDTAGSIYASGRIYESGTSIVDHATAMAIVFGG